VKTVTIVGVGNAGGAFAIALSRAGYTIEKLVHRSSAIARKLKSSEISHAELARWPKVGAINSKFVIIAVPDPEIGPVSDGLMSSLGKGQVVLHTSGSLTSEVLSDLARSGCDPGSIHPLVSISDPVRGAAQFQSAYFCIEGTPRAVREARQIVKAVHGKAFTIDPSKKALYHAAAVTAAGNVTALFDAAVEMLSKCGLSRQESAKILLPLTSSAVNNLGRQTPENALTGSFARLDIDAFERHLSSFGSISPSLRQIYLDMAERSLDMVERRHGQSAELTLFRRRISIAKRNSK
jgi:predicted short-subunit dehydrogenase-like oxidoreductase (DUF2520 family)